MISHRFLRNMFIFENYKRKKLTLFQTLDSFYSMLFCLYTVESCYGRRDKAL